MTSEKLEMLVVDDILCLGPKMENQVYKNEDGSETRINEKKYGALYEAYKDQFDMDTVTSVADACDKLKEKKYDIVVLDVEVGGRHGDFSEGLGIDLLYLIRLGKAYGQVSEDWSSVGIVSDESEREKIREMNGNTYLLGASSYWLDAELRSTIKKKIIEHVPSSRGLDSYLPCGGWGETGWHDELEKYFSQKQIKIGGKQNGK